jgi:flagellin
MSLMIQTNTASLQSQKNLAQAQDALATSFNRLSSGFRINSAADDAAGLAISDSMSAQIRSYTVAERNAGDGISMAQTADGALGELTNILSRMRELAVESANGSLQDTDRANLQTEFAQLTQEITRIQKTTSFNGKALLSATAASYSFQVGINNGTFDRLTVTFGGVALSTLLGGTVATALSARQVIDYADAGLRLIGTVRAKFGATMNRLAITTSNIQTARLNTSAANSRIRDVDVAEETSKLAKEQVLQQAGTAILAQANQLPQIALSLLRG